MTAKPGSTESLVQQAARAFDAELHTPAYARTHGDAVQLDRLISWLNVRNGDSVLDLGTGAGYIALELAMRHPSAKILALDVAERAIKRNIENASKNEIENVRFEAYDGITLPVGNNHLDGAVCRYAFHHVPCPDLTLAELSRTLTASGRFVFADAVRADADDADFINAFQTLKGDGHVGMLRQDEIIELLDQHGFTLIHAFDSALPFHRDRNEAYDRLVDSTAADCLGAYGLSIDRTRIHLTLPIFNGVFRHRK